MDDTYLTLESDSTGMYKEKGSKFISFASPVEDEEAIREKLAGLKKAYHDARHHCFAYVLGKEKATATYRVNDDGEPHHSAGDPILGQIRSQELTQVLIVVVRYFGGTKLGVGGLIQAYKTAAAEAIKSNHIIRQTISLNMALSFEFLAMDEVMRLIKKYELQILSQNYDNECLIEVACRKKMIEEVSGQFLAIPSVEILT